MADLFVYDLFANQKKGSYTDREKLELGWEFLADSLAFIEDTKYKSVTKHLISAWEKDMVNLGKVEKIEYSIDVMPSGKRAFHILVHFPWEDNKHISIWLMDVKTRMEDLKDFLKKYELALRDWIQKH